MDGKEARLDWGTKQRMNVEKDMVKRKDLTRTQGVNKKGNLNIFG